MFLRAALSNFARPLAKQTVKGQQTRSFMKQSKPKRGHGLEDYYDYPEFNTKMASPLGPWAVGMMCNMSVWIIIGPLFHSNYYYSGRILPKPEATTQLCDDSW